MLLKMNSQTNGDHQTSGPENDGFSKKKKSTRIVVGFLILIIIALIITIYFLLLKPEEEDRTIVTEENLDAIQEEMNQDADGSYYETSMTIDWTFDNGKKASKDAFVENPSSNSHTVYFDVNLSESNELVYSSPYIPVGKSLNSIKLEKKLEKGDYPAVVTYHLVDDDKKEVSTVSVEVTLHILN